MVRRTSAQKLYEDVVTRTVRRAVEDPENPLYEKFTTIENLDECSFTELRMKLELAGIMSIPAKADFKSWGVAYLCQLLGFVETENDYGLTLRFFKFMRKNFKKIVKDKKDFREYGDLCYDVFCNNMLKERTLATELASFMIFMFKDAEWFVKFLQVSYTLALLNEEATDEYYRIRYGMTFSEWVSQMLNSHTVINKSNEL